MNRDEILQLAKRELEKHDCSTRSSKLLRELATAAAPFRFAPHCKLKLQTISQFVRHLSDDVLAGIVDLALGGGPEPGLDDEEPRT